MIGRIDRDDAEEKKCNVRRYGMKFPSYKQGLIAGRRDRKRKAKLEPREKCPYFIPSDVLALLKKRARWFAGYDAGWQQVHLKKQMKRKKK